MIIMNVRRNFGTMHPDWQARANKTGIKGFHVTFQDGHQQDYPHGLVDIPDADIVAHGHVRTAKAIEEDVA